MDKSLAAVSISIEGGKVPAMNCGASPPTFNRVDSVMGDAAASSGVRVLQLHEWKEAALSLAESFAEDHSSMYFLETPDTAHWTEQKKWDLHLQMMEYIVYAHLLKGLVVSTGPNYDCIGLW